MQSYPDILPRNAFTGKLQTSKCQQVIVGMKDDIALRPAEYIGSFPVEGPDQKTRTEYVRQKLESLRTVQHSKSVLILISLSGIKICSIDGETVYMAHALRRVSYATCDPDYSQFSFLAREPNTQVNLQYCHAFLLASPQMAEELNRLVGEAFKQAYVKQAAIKQQRLHRQTVMSVPPPPSSPPPPTPSSPGPGPELIAELFQQQQQQHTTVEEGTTGPDTDARWAQEDLGKRLRRISTPQAADLAALRREQRFSMAAATGITGSGSGPAPPVTGAAVAVSGGRSASLCQIGGPGSVAFPLPRLDISGFVGSPVVAIKEHLDAESAANTAAAAAAQSLLAAAPASSNSRTGASAGYQQQEDLAGGSSRIPSNGRVWEQQPQQLEVWTGPVPVPPVRFDSLWQSNLDPILTTDEMGIFATHRSSARLPNGTHSMGGSSSGSSGPATSTTSTTLTSGLAGCSFLLSEVGASSYQSPGQEWGECAVSGAPPAWYQASLPREIALEMLTRQEIGSFVVRDSNTHPGCYALSVKVPKFDNPSGITHYLIQRTQRGVKLKGLDKEWPSLPSLVTHLTVMPEMLPCTLKLPPLPPSSHDSANPLFAQSDHHHHLAIHQQQQLLQQSVPLVQHSVPAFVPMATTTLMEHQEEDELDDEELANQMEYPGIEGEEDEEDDILEEDEDYQRLSDFSSIMADLRI